MSHGRKHLFSRYTEAQLWPVVLWLSCLLSAPLLAHEQDLAETHSHINSVSALADPHGTLSAEQVRERGRQGQFVALPQAFNQGYTTATWWLRFTLEANQQDAQLDLLEIGPAYLDDVRVYYFSKGELRQLGHQGDHQPFANRALPWRNSLFRLPADAWSAGIVYVRLQSTSALSADITLWQESAFYRNASHEILFYALIACLGALLALTSLILWRLLKQQNFLYFGIYMASLTCVALLFEGMVHYLLLPDSSRPLEKWQVVLQAIAVISMARLFLGIVLTETASPRLLRRLTLALALPPQLAALPTIFGYTSSSIQWLWLLFAVYFVGFGIIILLRNWRNSRTPQTRVRRSDWLYGIAFFSVSVPVVIRMQVIFGFSEPSLISNYIVLISMVAYIFLLYIALISHYTEFVADLREAEAGALAAIIESEQRLEGEVQQRTTDLDHSRQQLQQQLLHSEQQRDELDRTRQRLDQALDAERTASEAHGDFLRLVAHEFRTPLSVIDTACSVLEVQLHSSAAGTNLQRIRQASDSMSQLVDQALNEDKLNIAAWRYNSAWLSLADLLASSVEQARHHTRGQRIILQVFNSATVQGDSDMLRLMFSNLIDNAIKYSPDNSSIYVRLDNSDANQPRVSVIDQGAGIAAGEQPRLVEKFYRGADSGHRSGLGLGLYLVNRAAALHQAAFSIDSLPAGGTCASITFPAMAMEANA